MFDHPLSSSETLQTDQPSAKPALSQDETAIIDTARTILRRHAQDAIGIQSWSLLGDYLALSAVKERIEVLRVLFLDRKNKLIRDEIISYGTIDHIPVYVREIIRAAILLDASAMILCHNHPSGDPSPSQSDIQMTKQVVQGCEALGIEVHDHIIVGHGRERNAFSMRAEGMMPEL